MRKIIALFFMLLTVLSLSCCVKPTEQPSFTHAPTVMPKVSSTEIIQPTESIPTKEPATPSPTPTVIPPGSTYIEFYDLYADLSKTGEMKRDTIHWSEKGQRTEVFDKHNVITTIDTEEKVMYLTFNLGYEHVRGNTEKLLEILKNRNISATFFLVGEFIEVFPEKVRAIYADGHTLGAHSYYHIPPSHTMTDEEYIEDFIKTEKLLKIALDSDYKRMRYYRPISGEYCERDLYIAKALGYTTVLFDATYSDWNRTVINGYEYAYNELVKDIHKGAIYQLHIVTPDNIEALPVFLDELIGDGWMFKAFN